MSTAITELELSQPRVGLQVPARYEQALVLLRWQGRPVGQLRLPVTEGSIPAQALESALTEWAGFDFWLVWLQTALAWNEAEAPHMLPPATVAICTRNRPLDVTRALEALQRLPDMGHEVLVVDNRPSDWSTALAVAKFPTVRYVREDRGGLDAARNRALTEARHPIVAFTDDDAQVDPGWLAGLLRNFADPRVLCVTGLTLPSELETEAQELFERYSPFGRGFQRRVFDATEINPMAVGQVGAGANMAVRRDLLRLVGPFDEALDGGTPSRSGGDHEMFTRILASGYRIVYDPSALNWHRHRRTTPELRETLRGYGTGVYAMWTRALLVGRELSVFKQAFNWLRYGQIPELLRSVRPGSRRIPLSLLMSELGGCFAGPRAYLAARRVAAREARLANAGMMATRGHTTRDLQFTDVQCEPSPK